MNYLREQFEQKVQQLNEDAGRGRGTVGGFKSAKAGFEDYAKTINYDYLNRSTHHIFKEEKYNFNNYYSLDIRINIDNLLKAWETGAADYTAIFNEIYDDGNYEDKIKEKLRLEYEGYYNDLRAKKIKGGKPSPTLEIQPQHENITAWNASPLDDLISDEVINYVYSTMPAISIFSRNGGKTEELAIKRTEFVPLIMDGLKSAARGHVPQGVTIEEILEGKFSRKAIAPEQGTFINRVKDPTSDKSFDFRSWNTETMEQLHDIIMETFKHDVTLSKVIPELRQILVSDIKRSELFLYMTQDSFHRLEKGGKGFSDLGKAVLNDIGKVSEIPNF